MLFFYFFLYFNGVWPLFNKRLLTYLESNLATKKCIADAGVRNFELLGSQSMSRPLTYFHYPIRPMLLRKMGTEGSTLIFL